MLPCARSDSRFSQRMTLWAKWSDKAGDLIQMTNMACGSTQKKLSRKNLVLSQPANRSVIHFLPLHQKISEILAWALTIDRQLHPSRWKYVSLKPKIFHKQSRRPVRSPIRRQVRLVNLHRRWEVAHLSRETGSQSFNKANRWSSASQ